MKKKLLLAALSLSFAAAGAFGLAACDEHEHAWDNGTETTAATCTTAGLKTYACTHDGCEETKTETIAALGHDWNEWETTPATCTEAGSRTHTCKNDAAHTETEPIEALDHAWNEGEITTAATCTTAGLKTYACTHDGCEETKTETIEALNHAWNEGEITTAATCTTDGEKTISCTRDGCGATETEVITKKGHDWGEWETTPPTCTEDGSRTHTCKNDAAHTETEPIEALNHDWDEGEITTPATCTANGTKTISCKHNGCEVTQTQTINKTGHRLNDGEVTKAATCEDNGELTKSCQNAGCTYTKKESIASLGHEYIGELEVKKAPTQTAMGSAWRACSREGCEGHTLNLFSIRDGRYPAKRDTATCTAAGEKFYEVATVAGVAKFSVESPAKGHSYIWKQEKPDVKGLSKYHNPCINCGGYGEDAVQYNLTATATLEKTSVSMLKLTENTYLMSSTVTGTTAGAMQFKIQAAGTYKLTFNYLDNQRVFKVTKGRCGIFNNETDTGNPAISLTNTTIMTVSGDSDGVGPDSITFSFTEEHVGKYMRIACNTTTTTNKFIMTFEIPDTVETPELKKGGNKIKITQADSYEDAYSFTAAEDGKYSLKAPAGMTVTMNGEEFIDASSDSATKNFAVTAGTPVTFAFNHLTAGEYAVTVGDALPEYTISTEKQYTNSFSGMGSCTLTVDAGVEEKEYVFYATKISRNFLNGAMFTLVINGDADATYTVQAGSTQLDPHDYRVSDFALKLTLKAGDKITVTSSSGAAASATFGLAEVGGVVPGPY